MNFTHKTLHCIGLGAFRSVCTECGCISRSISWWNPRKTSCKPVQGWPYVYFRLQLHALTRSNHLIPVFYMFWCVFVGPSELLRVPYLVSEIPLNHHIFMLQLTYMGSANVAAMYPNHHIWSAQVFGTCFGVRNAKAHGFGCLIITGEQYRKKTWTWGAKLELRGACVPVSTV